MTGQDWGYGKEDGKRIQHLEALGALDNSQKYQGTVSITIYTFSYCVLFLPTTTTAEGNPLIRDYPYAEKDDCCLQH